MSESWIIMDGRTGEQVGMTSYSTKDRAVRTLEYYKTRHDAGRDRLDLRGKVPYWEVQRA